jgi:hypothetical protein
MESNSTDIGNRSSRTAEPRSITEQIIRVVTESDDRSREDLEPLYEAIDPDALSALFAPRTDESSRAVGDVSFEYAGYWVTVSSEGVVETDAIDR